MNHIIAVVVVVVVINNNIIIIIRKGITILIEGNIDVVIIFIDIVIYPPIRYETFIIDGRGYHDRVKR